MKKKILFVCLGNICRSSAAEGVMRRLAEEAGRAAEYEIDSAGILSVHRGELPDPRMRAHAARRGYELVHRSRPVTTDDFFDFDLIVGMDARNMDDLRERAPSPAEWDKLRLMTDFCTRHPHADHIPLITGAPRALSMCSICWKMPVPGCFIARDRHLRSNASRC